MGEGMEEGMEAARYVSGKWIGLCSCGTGLQGISGLMGAALHSSTVGRKAGKLWRWCSRISSRLKLSAGGRPVDASWVPTGARQTGKVKVSGEPFVGLDGRCLCAAFDARAISRGP